MQTTTLDRLMGRLLFVTPPAHLESKTDDRSEAGSAERALGFSLMFSGVRCVLQYAVLPFMLPLIGVAAGVTVPILLTINVLAMVSIFFSLRRFWKIGYKYRWHYLGVAIVALVLLTTFLVMDMQSLGML